MHRIFIVAALCALIAGPVAAATGQSRVSRVSVITINWGIAQISPQEAKAWLCYTVPLPKQIEIKAEAIVQPGDVGIEIKAPDKHPVYDQIREEFMGICGSSVDMSGDTAFWIRIHVGGEEAEPLKALANSNQAYSITSSQDNKSLTITALTYRGAYYGWKTVEQLIRGRSTNGRLNITALAGWSNGLGRTTGGDMGAVVNLDRTLRIPILTVTDWPDMEKRGLWGTDNYNHLAWLGERKMNHMEQINARGVDEQGNFYAYTRESDKLLDTDCEKYAIDYAPVILHLGQVWQEETMGKFYPQMKAKNATFASALCYSEPKTIEMISAWIYQLAKQSPSREVDVWMTENMGGKVGCQCEECRKEHHTVNEARAIIKAWEMAKQKLGSYITLYMLTSEATEDHNKQIFSEIPKDVRIWYYHSLLTYNSIRQPMLRDYLADAAKNGRWMGVCPNLDAWTHNDVPFDGASFIKYRMDEFVAKGFKGLLGYATPRVQYDAFNVEAAAEWTWNDKGRTTREFAYSHAVREGYRDPEKFADWSEALGPVGWDVYGSNWPSGQKRGQAVTVKEGLTHGTLPPLGYVLWDAWPFPWGNIKTEQQLYDDVAAAGRAVELARGLGVPEIMYQTLAIDGYIRSLKALYELKKLAPKGGAFAPKDREEARKQAQAFLIAAEQTEQYLPKWESCVHSPDEPDADFASRPVGIMKEVADDVKAACAEMGVGIK